MDSDDEDIAEEEHVETYFMQTGEHTAQSLIRYVETMANLV